VKALHAPDNLNKNEPNRLFRPLFPGIFLKFLALLEDVSSSDILHDYDHQVVFLINETVLVIDDIWVLNGS
jgi:hypothetical protein